MHKQLLIHHLARILLLAFFTIQPVFRLISELAFAVAVLVSEVESAAVRPVDLLLSAAGRLQTNIASTAAKIASASIRPIARPTSADFRLASATIRPAFAAARLASAVISFSYQPSSAESE